jgi:hypothetical protein
VIYLSSRRAATTEPVSTANSNARFAAMNVEQIRLFGGGRFSGGAGYVVLTDDADARAALAALGSAGIVASQLGPKSNPKHDQRSAFLFVPRPDRSKRRSTEDRCVVGER